MIRYLNGIETFFRENIFSEGNFVELFQLLSSKLGMCRAYEYEWGHRS